jgi:glycosyltransferase involved in cell wall biosynthesis
MVNKYYPPHIGGIEYHVRDLAEGLAARDLAQVRVLVANEGSDTVTETVNGVEVTRLPRQFKISSAPVAFGMGSALKSEASREDPADLLHLHFPYPWGELSWLGADPGLPTVLSYHSDIVRQKALMVGYRPFLERLLDRVDAIIAATPQMVEHSPYLSKHADKCRIVPYGLHVERFAGTPKIRDRAQQIRAGHERPIVLFVGRLVYYKGAEVLVRAMAGLDADLVMIGDGPLESRLREIAVAQGTADRITFLPPAPEEELVAFYHAAEVFCLPSVADSEAFGLVQIEAHAAGTPVVSSALPTGVVFANLDGVTGLTVPPGDVEALASALGRLLDDPDLRARLGAQARDRALCDFTVERMVDDTVRVYEEVMEGRRAS